jgi:hypothetical protein
MSKKARRRLAAVWVVVVIIAVVLVIPATISATREGTLESVRSIRETVQERALQCYVIEGAYPSSLSYLEENYGLTLNQEDYLVVYQPVAENLPPDVRVVKREKQ